MEKAISLFDAFGNQIITRNSIRSFLDLLSRAPKKDIILDFKNIRFISRSCADEYMKWKINYMERKNIKEINMNREVKLMFKLVLLQYNKNFGLTA